TCFEKAEDYAKSIEFMTNEEMRIIFEERAFVYPIDITDGLSECHIIHLSENEIFGKATFSQDYNGSVQPSFNKNFSLLIENFLANTSASFENFLFTENSKQIERFYNIFEDLQAKVDFHPVISSIHEGFIDGHLKIACYTDHEIFQRFHRYKLRQGFTKDQALSLRMLREMEVGDFVVHIDHGVGRFSGLEKIEISGHVQESVRLIYQNNDILYVGINSLHKISKFVGKDGTPPSLSKIGGDAWKNLKRKTKGKVKDMAQELIKLYAKRKASKGFAFSPDNYLQNELEASFIYEDTPDQYTATQAVKEDMQKDYPMDRLICGDVGFGKTEIAVRAAFKAIADGKQVAILVPTTILALQHYQTFSSRLKEFNVKCDYLNRFKSTKQKKEIFSGLKDGSLELIIGTHAILSKNIEFKDLGLLVIDEEQKFGVGAKEKLRSIKVNVDTLTLTATPIPRTLQFSLMSARDLSIIRTPPPNRQPIHTERRVFSDELVRESIYYEVNRGGQVFFVHNRVKSLSDIADLIKRLCPDVSVKMAHGQMESDQLEKVLVEFIDGEFDVLVSTNIIETGLDIPNANTIIINNANQFGMSDLHQLRGRVGRSNRKAFCYLFAPPLSVLTDDARKRLKTLEEFSELGSGFQISMKDLDIRGAGNLLGAEQSGFIADIGYETFQKILEEAVMELKESTFKELFKDELGKRRDFVRDVEIDSDTEMLIPDTYVSNIQERLSLYTELDGIEDEDGLLQFREMIKDRFGQIPGQV
ncbi:MAG: transcription-repair coupling factor, partial [Caldilineaceae bacterium]